MNYQLGPWQFNTELGLLHCEHSEQELDPLTVKLLIYFISHPQSIVSRKQLMDIVWQQSHVDDNAINRAMSELKKHLKHPALKEPLIKTHYRQGYSLELLPRKVDISQTMSILHSKKKAAFNKRLSILCSLLVLIALTLAAYWYTHPQNTLLPSPDFKLDIIDNNSNHTSDMRPLLSDNKDYLASTRRYLKLGERKIHIQRLSDKKIITFTPPKFNLFIAMTWQNQQDRLVIKSVNTSSDKCEYLLADISNFDAPPIFSTIKQCNFKMDSFASLDKEGRFFYYTSANNKHKNNALVRYDLKTKKMINLIPSRPDTPGPKLPLLSPNGKKLAYLVPTLDKRTQIYLKDLSTFEAKLIYQSIHSMEYPFALDWVNNDTLRYIDHNQMLTFNTNDYTLLNRFSLPRFVLPRHITHKSPTDIYFSSRHINHYEIKQVNSFDNPESFFTLFESKQNSQGIQHDNVTKNNYFVSYRSGQAQIWLGDQRELKQLSNFNNQVTSIAALKVSPNGKSLLYFRDNKYLEILNINTGQIKQIDAVDPNQISDLIWGPDSHSIIYLNKNETHEIQHYDLINQKHKVFATLAAISLFSNNKGIPFASTEQGLVDLTTKKMYPLPSNIQLIPLLLFDQVDEYFYANDNYGKKIYRWQKNDKLAEVMNVEFLFITMDITDNHELLFNAVTKLNSKVERIWWQPLENSN